jgi:hypothetical protein
MVKRSLSSHISKRSIIKSGLKSKKIEKPVEKEGDLDEL